MKQPWEKPRVERYKVPRHRRGDMHTAFQGALTVASVARLLRTQRRINTGLEGFEDFLASEHG